MEHGKFMVDWYWFMMIIYFFSDDFIGDSYHLAN